MSTFSTIGTTTTADQRSYPLRSLTPLAPASFTSQSISIRPTYLAAQLCHDESPPCSILSGMPQSISPPPHAPTITQPSTDGTFILPLIQPKNPSKRDPGTLQHPAGSSSLLLSSLQHQERCLQAIHKTIQ